LALAHAASKNQYLKSKLPHSEHPQGCGVYQINLHRLFFFTSAHTIRFDNNSNILKKHISSAQKKKNQVLSAII